MKIRNRSSLSTLIHAVLRCLLGLLLLLLLQAGNDVGLPAVAAPGEDGAFGSSQNSSEDAFVAKSASGRDTVTEFKEFQSILTNAASDTDAHAFDGPNHNIDSKINTLSDSTPPAFDKHVVDSAVDGPISVYATDIDSDGHVDIVAGATHADELLWWRNDGAQNFTRQQIANDVDAIHGVYATDVDSDGDMDVLGASRNDRNIRWWENDGNEQFTSHVVASDFGLARSVYATDVDGDGDVDILGTDADEDDPDKIAWWENDGDQNFVQHVIAEHFDAAWSVYAIDLDRDGDIDVLGAAGGADEIAWWENDGNQSFTKRVVVDNFDDPRCAYATDLDGDGDIDILGAAAVAGQIAWWENDGSQSFSKHLVVTDFNWAAWVYATDVDGDGDEDILGTAYYGDEIAWWENDGNGNFTQHTLSDHFDGAHSVYATDLDGDGDTDIIGSAYDGDEIAWWEQSSDAAPTCIAPPEGLVSWWPGDGSAADIWGNNDGTLLNGAGFAPGKAGQAFSFDGLDDYVEVANEEVFDFGAGPFSITAWIKTSGGRSFNEHFISKGEHWGGGDDYILWVSRLDGHIQFQYSHADVHDDLIGSTATDDANWHFVTVTQSGACSGCAKLYVDGVLEDTKDGRTLVNGTLPFIIGAAKGSDGNLFSFKGMVDEVSVYNRALTASEVQAIYNAGSAGKCKEVEPLTDPLSLEPLFPESNTQQSEVMQTGVAHRYYVIRDANGQLASNVQVTANPTGSGSSDSNGILDLAIPADELGSPSKYSVSVTGLSRGDTEYELDEPVSFDVEVKKREFEHHWYGGTVRRAKGGISAGLIAYLKGEIKGGLGWSLVETDADMDDDDVLRLREQFQTAVGGGVGVGVPLGVKAAGIFRAEAGATATTELLGLAMTEWQSQYDSPYTESAQKAQAVFVLAGLMDMAPTAPGQPMLAGVLKRLLPNSHHDAYSEHVAGGIGAQWTTQAKAGVEVSLGFGSDEGQIANTHTLLYTPTLLEESEPKLKIPILQLDALDTALTLRLFGTLTDYQKANEWGLSLEQEKGFDLDLLTGELIGVKPKLGLFLGEASTKVKEELFFDKETGLPKRFELSLTGEGNTSTFPEIDPELESVTIKFIVEGEDLELALQRVRNLTALLAAWDDLEEQGVVVGSGAVLKEIETYLDSLPLSRYEVYAATDSGTELVPEIGFSAGYDVSLGGGVEFGQGRDILVERGYLTAKDAILMKAGFLSVNNPTFPLEVYGDYEYGNEPGRSIGDLLRNAASGAWLVVKDSFKSIVKAVEQGTDWAVGLISETTEGIVRGGARLLGHSDVTFQSVTLDGKPQATTESFAVTATSWVPDGGNTVTTSGIASNRLLSTSGEGFAIGGIYQFEPYTMTLQPSATLAITYTTEAAGTADPNQFDIYRWRREENNWQPLSAVHDPASRVMTTTVSQLGTYLIGYDVTEPTVNPVQPSPVVTKTHFPQFIATISDSGSGIVPDSVSMTVAGTSVDANYAPLSNRLAYTSTTYLPNGTYTYTISAADTAENTVSHQDAFEVAVPAPDVVEVDPSVVYQGTSSTVTVRGRLFAYPATLALGSQELSDIGYQGLTAYTATVPIDLGYGSYDLILINPDGGEDTLQDAVAVTIWGDVTGDCVVDVADAQKQASYWRQSIDLPYDLDGDGMGTIADVMQVVPHWNETCPAILSSVPSRGTD